jgi:signal transduction histidine kinase/streptogramin lyase
MGPLCQIQNEQLKCYGKAEGIPFPIALHIATANSGELWVGGYSELCRWKPGSSCESYFTNGTRAPETFESLRGIATALDGTVWAVRDRPGAFLQLEHFEKDEWTTHAFPQIAVSNSDVTTLFIDRDNVLWVGTGNHGLFRVVGNSIDNYAHTDGLTSDSVWRFYQDTEGTVWALTSGGLDNFRDISVLSYSVREGLSASGAGTVLATRDGSVWIGNFHALDRVQGNTISSIRPGHGLPGLYVTTFAEDHAGNLWVGIDSGLWVYDGRAFRAIRHMDGSPLGVVFAIAEDTRHNVWTLAGHKLVRIFDSRVQEEIATPLMSTAFTLAANPQGGIFIGLVSGDLIQYGEDGKSRTFPSNETGNTRQIRDLLAEPDGSVWGTTVDEIARWKNGVRKNLTRQNGIPCDGIFALVEDAQGSLWFDSKCGFFQIEKSQLDNWWNHPDSLVKFKLLDVFDGAQPGLTPLKPQATRSTDGRLWFVNTRILQMLDLRHLVNNPVPPPVEIEDVRADRKDYPAQAGLRLPALTRDLEINYTAPSFVAPQKVLFRYKLENHDTEWQEPGTRRQAFYNDLQPGPYRFHVMASNNDGVWNETGAALDFSILPAYYQTTWFRLICAAVFLLLLWAIYQLRMRQLHRQFSIGLEARVNERTRIARELHDTLLQTLHGLMFQFQAVRNLLPRRPDEAMKSLDEAITETEKALSEGRDAIQGLRSEPMTKGNLAELLMTASQELAAAETSTQPPPAFELIEEGEHRNLSPAIKDEVCRIALELLRNAYRHAHAHRIEAEVRYGADVLRLRIRDDGKGIDLKVLKDGGVTGHWGLRGIRERAERIGAKLDFWSEAGAGTEIQLMVPGSAAYETSRDPAAPKVGKHG